MKTFEKIVLITSPEYSVYIEKFVRCKVSVFCVTAGNLSNVAAAVKCRRKFEPSRTLWLTHPEVFKIDCVEKSDLCTTCKEPLEIHVLPSTSSKTYSNYANEILSSFDELSKTVNSLLNAESSFAILPPLPPSFLPLEENEHDFHHKTVKGKKKYYFTTSSAIKEFESLYDELSKQIIHFSLAEIEKGNITFRSLAQYFNIVKSWNSYVNITQTNELQSTEYVYGKYNQWFEHIDIFLSDMLKPSNGEHLKLSSEMAVDDLTSAVKEDYPECSEFRDDLSDILDEILDEIPIIDEDSEPEIITLDSSTPSPKPEPINSENYDHIVFICFCKAHAKLIPREQELSKKTSVILIKSNLNWRKEKSKFDIFTQVHNSILFIVIGSINLLGNEYQDKLCINEKCTDPLLCLGFGQDSNGQIFNKTVNRYGQFMKKLRNYFEKLSAVFILTPMITVKCTPMPDIINESYHQDIHKLLADSNIYLTVGGNERWSSLTNIFQMSHFIRMLKEGHTSNEIEIFGNVLKEINYTSKPHISWVKLSGTTSIIDSDYDEDEFKILLKKFVDVLCPDYKNKVKGLDCSAYQNVEDKIKNSSTLTSTRSLINQERQKLTNINTDNATIQLTSAVNSKSIASRASLEKTDVLIKTSDPSQSAKTQTVDSRDSQMTPEYSKEYICLFKILLEDHIADVVAVRIKTLQKDTSSKVEISKQFDFFPGTFQRVCLITGNISAVLKVIFLIIDVTKENTSRGRAFEVEFVVPDSSAKQIIGEKDENIQRIKFQSKAYMWRNNQKNYPSPHEACFVVRSCAIKFMQRAFSMILVYIYIGSGSDSCSNNSYPSVLPASSSEDSIPSSKIVDSGMPRLMLESNEDKICHLKILLERDVAKAVIRDHGKGLQKLQEKSNSKITISKEGEYFPHTCEHICLIAGVADAVLKALFAIVKTVKCRSPRLEIRFVVPDSTARLIVGEKEENLRKIMIQGNTYLVDKKKTYPSPNETCFVIRSYTVENIKTAFSMILQYISNDPKNGACKNIVYPVGSLKTFRSGNARKSEAETDNSSRTLNREIDASTSKIGLSQKLPEVVQRENNIWHFKVLTPPPVASVIVGPKEINLLQIRKDTKCQIEVSKAHYPGTNDQVCSLSGSFDSVLTTVFLILDIVKEKFDRIASSLQLKFVVPTRIAEKNVIGTDRAILNKIKTESKANVELCLNSKGFSKREKCFLVDSPDVENMKEAFCMILKKISQDSPKRFDNDSQKRFSQDSQKRFGNDSQKRFSQDSPKRFDNDSQKRFSQDSQKRFGNDSQKRFSQDSQKRFGNDSQKRFRNHSQKRFQTFPYGTEPPPSMIALPKQDGSNSNPFITPSFRERYNLGSQDYEYRKTENYGNYITDSNQHNYPVSNEYSSSYAANNYPASNRQGLASEYPLERQEICSAPVSGNQVTSRYPADGNQNYRSPSDDSGYEHHFEGSWQRFSHRSRSPSPVKKRRLYSRSRSRSNRSSTASPNRKCQAVSEAGDEFSLTGAMDLLERVCDRCGSLSETIKEFATTVKSALEVDRTKALRLIKGGNNVLLGVVKELKSCIAWAPIEEIGLLSKAVEWTNYLIKYAEKIKEPERNINLRAIAEASLNKPSDFVLNLIKSTFQYGGKSNPSSEDISEAFFKVSSLQCEMILNDNSESNN